MSKRQLPKDVTLLLELKRRLEQYEWGQFTYDSCLVGHAHIATTGRRWGDDRFITKSQRDDYHRLLADLSPYTQPRPAHLLYLVLFAVAFSFKFFIPKSVIKTWHASRIIGFNDSRRTSLTDVHRVVNRAIDAKLAKHGIHKELVGA